MIGVRAYMAPDGIAVCGPTYCGGILLFFQQKVSLERRRGSLGVLSCQECIIFVPVISPRATYLLIR